MMVAQEQCAPLFNVVVAIVVFSCSTLNLSYSVDLDSIDKIYFLMTTMQGAERAPQVHIIGGTQKKM